MLTYILIQSAFVPGVGHVASIGKRRSPTEAIYGHLTTGTDPAEAEAMARWVAEEREAAVELAVEMLPLPPKPEDVPKEDPEAVLAAWREECEELVAQARKDTEASAPPTSWRGPWPLDYAKTMLARLLALAGDGATGPTTHDREIMLWVADGSRPKDRIRQEDLRRLETLGYVEQVEERSLNRRESWKLTEKAELLLRDGATIS